MSDSETTNKFSLIDLPDIPESIDNAAKNITDYPSKNIGTTLGDVWYLVFGGISQAASKRRMKYAEDLKKYQKELENATNDIPEEDKVEPSIQVTAQALENSKYCISSEKLREMFVKLISGTMNKKLEPFVHPSFPEILKQMSEKDALFLKVFKNTEEIPIVCIGVENEKKSYKNMAFDICNVIPDGMNEQECSTSISALQHAGLLTTTYQQWFENNAYYEPFKDHPFYKQLETLSPPHGMAVHLQKGKCILTKLGKDFIHVCIE